MSILNALLAPDRLIVAVDTFAEDALTALPSSAAKLLLIPQYHIVLATRGRAQFLRRVYDVCLQASFRSDFSLDRLSLELGSTIDRLWPSYVEGAEEAGLALHQLRTEIVLGGWSVNERRMVATAFAKHAAETPTLIQPLIDGLASPGEPLRGRANSFDPGEILGAGVLQANYLNERSGRQVAGGSLLVAQLREREARINEWPFVQPGLVRRQAGWGERPVTDEV